MPESNPQGNPAKLLQVGFEGHFFGKREDFCHNWEDFC